MPKDHRGESRGIAFIEYSHQESVPYALQLFVGSKLFARPLNMRSRNNTNPVALTPQFIEANNPLTAPSSALLRGHDLQHLQPQSRFARSPATASGNPFENITDPALLMALSANFHGGGYQDLGKYNDQRSDYRDDDNRSHKMSRGNSYRKHESNNPYNKRDDRRDGGGGGYNDHGRDWANGGGGRNRRRY